MWTSSVRCENNGRGPCIGRTSSCISLCGGCKEEEEEEEDEDEEDRDGWSVVSLVMAGF